MLAWFLGTRAGRIAETLLVAAGVVFAAVMYGRTGQKKATQIKELEDYVETRKKVDAVAPSADRPAALRRMRKNGWIR